MNTEQNFLSLARESSIEPTPLSIPLLVNASNLISVEEWMRTSGTITPHANSKTDGSAFANLFLFLFPDQQPTKEELNHLATIRRTMDETVLKTIIEDETWSKQPGKFLCRISDLLQDRGVKEVTAAAIREIMLQEKFEMDISRSHRLNELCQSFKPGDHNCRTLRELLDIIAFERYPLPELFHIEPNQWCAPKLRQPVEPVISAAPRVREAPPACLTEAFEASNENNEGPNPRPAITEMPNPRPAKPITHTIFECDLPYPVLIVGAMIILFYIFFL